MTWLHQLTARMDAWWATLAHAGQVAMHAVQTAGVSQLSGQLRARSSGHQSLQVVRQAYAQSEAQMASS